MSYNKVATATGTISTKLFLILGMTPNSPNTILNMEKGCQEIPLQGTDFDNSQKLSKAVAIYKTNSSKLVAIYMSLKTRSSEKVPYKK